eukprot:6501517-Ditylum_brightwellii.AAC.1
MNAKNSSDVKELCRSTTKIVILEIPTETTLHDRRGMALVDVQFSGFDAAVEGSCSANSAIFIYGDH